MDIDFKSILLVIVIIGVVAAMIFGGYKILELDKKPENVAQEETNIVEKPKNVVKDFSAVKNTTKPAEPIVENDTDTAEGEDETEAPRNPLALRNIEKNNTSPKTTFEGETYVGRKITYTYLQRYTLNYQIPKSWADGASDRDPITGANIRCVAHELSEIGEYNEDENTYDDVVSDYLEIERQTSSFPNDLNFRKREIYIPGYGMYPIYEGVETYGITEYMIFVYKGNLFSIQITVSNDDDYNAEFLKTVDNIFASAYIGGLIN